jgi:hypothetical protein
LCAALEKTGSSVKIVGAFENTGMTGDAEMRKNRAGARASIDFRFR